jgi:hypothetical protein
MPALVSGAFLLQLLWCQGLFAHRAAATRRRRRRVRASFLVSYSAASEVRETTDFRDVLPWDDSRGHSPLLC